jgi:hypothetical protein
MDPRMSSHSRRRLFMASVSFEENSDNNMAHKSFQK